MRNRSAWLLLISVCLFSFIGSVAQAPEKTTFLIAATEETVTVTTKTTEETSTPTTKPTVPETTEAPTEPPATEPPATTSEVEEQPTEPEEPDGGLRSLGTFTLTAYCSCQKCCGSYAINRPVDENGDEIVYGLIGVRLEAGVSIAVDPNVIPYGTQVVINGHTYTAHDTGGSIVGNRIDVYFDDHQEAWNFGTQYAEVFLYRKVGASR